MRKIQAVLMLTLVIAVAGCPEGGRMNLIRPSGDSAKSTPPPAKEDLVAYLNNNAAKIPGIQSSDITLTCYMDSGFGIPLGGKLCAQRAAQIPHDRQRHWQPGSRSRFQRSRVLVLDSSRRQVSVLLSLPGYRRWQRQIHAIPFPAGLGARGHGHGQLWLAGKIRTGCGNRPAQTDRKNQVAPGVPVKKIIVFRRWEAKGDDSQVPKLLLEDEKTGKLICSAQVVRRQRLPNGAELPKELKLEWPEQKLKLVLNLNGVHVTQNLPPNAFVRAPLDGVPSLNMATGRVEALQQAGGPKGIPH